MTIPEPPAFAPKPVEPASLPPPPPPPRFVVPVVPTSVGDGGIGQSANEVDDSAPGQAGIVVIRYPIT